MKLFALLAAVSVALSSGCATPPPSATAEEIPVHVFEAEHVRMQLMPGRCADGRSAAIAASAGPEYSERWRAIRSIWRGRDGSWKEFAGCWLELTAEEAGAPGAVLALVFSDGERFVVLKSDFLGAEGTGS